MRILHWLIRIHWQIVRGIARQFLLYFISPGIAAIVFVYVSSQVFGLDVESKHAGWREPDGKTVEGWLFLSPGIEGCLGETHDANGQLVSTVYAELPVGTFLTKRSRAHDFTTKMEEISYHSTGHVDCHHLVERDGDKLHGVWTYYRENGTKLSRTWSVNELSHREVKWHESGELLYERKFYHDSFGKPLGVCRLWNVRGELIGEGHIATDGQKHGVFPLSSKKEPARLVVFQDGQQVEELEFTPDIPPVHWQGEPAVPSSELTSLGVSRTPKSE